MRIGAEHPDRVQYPLPGGLGLLVGEQRVVEGGLDVLLPRNPGDGALELACRTEIGKQYRLQSSTDGRAWEDVTNFRAATAQSTYRATATGTTVRLYRLVSP